MEVAVATSSASEAVRPRRIAGNSAAESLSCGGIRSSGSPGEPPPLLNMQNVECSDKEVLRDGEVKTVPIAVRIQGRDAKMIKYKELRVICRRLGVVGYKNKAKEKLLELIAQKKINGATHDAICRAKKAERHEPTRKQVQCPFRLLNVLFSAGFAARLDALGGQRTRADLDASVSVEDAFWKDVHAAFVDDTVEEFAQLIDHHPALDPTAIGLSKIIQHKPKELREMWVSTRAAYKKAVTRFTASGTHSSEFYASCDGRLDALYLFLHLHKRPELVGTVGCALPDDVFCETTSDLPSSTSSIADTPSKHNTDLAEAIRELGNQPWRENMATRKLETAERKLRFLEGKEARKILYRERRDQREERNASLQQFTFVCDRLRELYRQREGESSRAIVEDLDEEISILKGRKRSLAAVL
ncbi:hypothetical protein BBJ28_00020372 [Nothophytophthora sp. Chile5]|nr:hypothetical protein BBJ28_00020372 [Nothophytophthora sp. Chile5]